MSVSYDFGMGKWAVSLGSGHALYFDSEEDAKMADTVITFVEEGQQLFANARVALNEMAGWIRRYDLAYAGVIDEASLATTSIIPGDYELPDGLGGHTDVTGKLGTLQMARYVLWDIITTYADPVAGTPFERFAVEHTT